MEKIQWRTEIQLEPAKFSISHTDSMLLLGSCFAENIGAKLRYFGFDASINPTGILYNPIALLQMLEIFSDPSILQANRFIKRQNTIFHYDFHSDFHANTETDFIAKTREISESINLKPDYLIITLGTAWVYEYDHKVTGNCHKQSAVLFEKRLLSINEIAAALQQIRQLIDPSTRLILTVSPVRHVKDGMIENQHSKAHLISAVHRFLERNEKDQYFPAYEIMMDDLRDYRFYKKDMLHPNIQAVEYIWQLFTHSFFQEKTRELNHEISKIRNMEQHRSFFPESDEHIAFLDKLKSRKAELLAIHPYIDL